jgi:hypothetical protein
MASLKRPCPNRGAVKTITSSAESASSSKCPRLSFFIDRPAVPGWDGFFPLSIRPSSSYFESVLSCSLACFSARFHFFLIRLPKHGRTHPHTYTQPCLVCAHVAQRCARTVVSTWPECPPKKKGGPSPVFPETARSAPAPLSARIIIIITN